MAIEVIGNSEELELADDRHDAICIGIYSQGDLLFSLPLVYAADVAGRQAFRDYQMRYQGILDPCVPDALDKILHMASEWLRTCRESHSRCGSSPNMDEAKVLPTRLIDVGLEHDAQPPKLAIPSNDRLDLEYLILSYAWGPRSNFLKTTASNLESNRQSLPWDGLPKTIQDAIILTRKMGVRYLWVDALCIIQPEGLNDDDAKHKEDWSCEAERFGSYYQNALLTISASGARSCHEGLFLPRSGSAFPPRSVTLRPMGNLAVRSLRPNWDTEVLSSHLSRRGWALQERFLSKRLLHFGASLILWECHESRTSELDPRDLDPDGLECPDEVNCSYFLHTFRNLDKEKVHLDQFMEQWLQFLGNYSLAEFSYKSDMLPALSGIAGVVKSSIQEKYIAGLWEPILVRGLTWITYELRFVDFPKGTKVDKGRQLDIPSWCWAASRHKICFPRPHDWKSMCKIEDCDVKCQGSETSGQLLGGRLRIRGSFARLELSDMGFQFLQEYGEDIGCRAYKYWRNCQISRVCMDEAADSQTLDLSHPCLLVGTAFCEEEKKLEGHAIILQSSGFSSGSVDEYRRIGMLHLPLKEYMDKAEGERTIDLV